MSKKKSKPKIADLTSCWCNRLSDLRAKHPNLPELLKISSSSIYKLTNKRRNRLKVITLNAIKSLYRDDQAKMIDIEPETIESECVLDSNEPITDNSYKKPQHIIIWKDQLVLTLAQAADYYQVTTNSIKNNFHRNKKRFIESEHYFKLENDDLKLFKNEVTNCDRVNSLLLFTEKGMFNIAKSCGSDKAWQIYKKLVDTYFNQEPPAAVVSNPKPAPNPSPLEAFDIPEDLGEALLLASKLFKDGQQKQLKLDAQTEEIDYLEVEIKDMRPKAEYHDEVLNTTNGIASTSIAAELGMTAILLHKKLDQDLGIIRRIGSDWVLRSKYLDKGYTTTYTFTRPKKDGSVFSKIVTVWTQKGRKFLLGLNYFQPELSFVANKDVAKNDKD